MPDIDYTAVLEDLKRRRAKLDAAIEAIGQIIGSGALADSGPVGAVQTPTAISEDTFFGLPILDAAMKYLGMVKKPQTAAEIAEALERGGFTHSSKSFNNTVYTMLKRDYDRGGEITKIGRNKWALASWYPGRKSNQRPRPAAGQEESDEEDEPMTPLLESPDSNEPEQPSEQSPLDAQE